MIEVEQNKKQLREQFKQVRQNISAQERQQKEQSLSENIQRLLTEVEPNDCVAVYKPFASEANFKLSEDYQIALPVMSGLSLKFYKTDLETRFIEHGWGLQEPDPNTAIPVGDFEVCLVPGLAFDRRGARLGSGRGYYDRFLSEFLGLKVGVCFSEQVANYWLPTEEHDQRMNYLVTDEYILRIME